MQPRPWGSFETCAFLPGRGALKILRIDAGQRISLQRHKARTEHWVVLQGTGQAELDGESVAVCRGDHLVIRPKVWHRLSNIGGDGTLVVAETQVGDYATASLAEEDIERAQDDYGRATATLSME